MGEPKHRSSIPRSLVLDYLEDWMCECETFFDAFYRRNPVDRLIVYPLEGYVTILWKRRHKIIEKKELHTIEEADEYFRHLQKQ